MKNSRLLLIVSVTLGLSSNSQRTQAITYLGNLDHPGIPGIIGDIQGLFPGGEHYGNDTVSFTTGAGSFSLNAVTFEFQAFSERLSVQLFQSGSLLANLGNPELDPRATRWPGYTHFFDFSPLRAITLAPFTEYSLVLSMPADQPDTVGLLFTTSPADTALAGWTMGPTITGSPSAAGEHLVVAVDAAPVPETNSAALLLFCASAILIGGDVRKSTAVKELI
jgi:hypothetical protein